MNLGRLSGTNSSPAVRYSSNHIHLCSWNHICCLLLLIVSWTTSALSTVGIVPSNTFPTGSTSATTVSTKDTIFNPSQSPPPTVTANPHIIPATEIDTIVMEEGLSEEDKKFFERVQSSVKTVLNWEDVEVIKLCREQIPWKVLQNSNGKFSRPQDRYLQGDALFLQRLCRWFPTFMNWVNAPPCKVCGCTDTEFQTVRGPESEEEKEGQARRVEVYYCPTCNANTTTFPRFNKARKLLETKLGRCGEYSNLFGLFCRSAGLETRLVLDLSDHLWTEVWLGDSWVMADGCEGIIDKPSMYEYGWGKEELSYMIGIGNDHVVDVTPRYTRQFMTEDFQNRRRTHTSSEQFSEEVLRRVNSRLQSLLPKNRLDALRKRNKVEAAELQWFKQATEWTPQEKYGRGRISGSAAWKQARQEDGSKVVDKDGNSSSIELQQVTGFQVESFSPPITDKLAFVVKPKPISRHDSIMVANTPCAIGENNTISVVVVDEIYFGTILQSRAFLKWKDAQDFIDGLPSNRIVLMNGSCKLNQEEALTEIQMPRLGGWKVEDEVVEKGVVYIGQVDAHPDWAFCTTVEDCNPKGHTIVLRTSSELSLAKEKVLKTERRVFPQKVAGRVPESIMPLKSQLLATEEQKRLAFTSFSKLSSKPYSGFVTKQNAPIYLLDSTSYPFQKVDSMTTANESSDWSTFHFLPRPLVPDEFEDANKLNLPSFDIPLESNFLTSSLGHELLTQNGAKVPTLEALHNSRLLGLYFSAHWCGPCRSFTPMLAEMYAHLKDVRPSHGLEIVFVSSDRDPFSFQQYFSSMPWQAIPFENLQFVKQSLNMTYGVRGIPSLVVLDTLTGRVVIPPQESRQAVAMACRGGELAIENMLESWLERAPQESREILTMLELSCVEETNRNVNENEKESEYLTKHEDSQHITKLSAGTLNGKAIQSGPHTDENLLDQTFANAMNCNSPVVVAEVLSTMLKYVNNAAKEPWTNRYRSFKLSNKVADQITRVEGGLGLLQGIGFDISFTSQDFKATIPVGADLDAMTQRLVHLLEGIS